MYGRADWNKIRHKFNFGIVPGYHFEMIPKTFYFLSSSFAILKWIIQYYFSKKLTAEEKIMAWKVNLLRINMGIKYITQNTH